MSSLIFVSGALRSGTTILHLMLNSHPEIHSPGEFDFLFDYIEPIKQHNIDFIKNKLKSDRIFNSQNLSFSQCSSTSKSQFLMDLVNQVSKNKVLALNVHRNFDRIPIFFPSAKYIHLVRDPRDVARSCIGMGWAGNVYYGVDHWIDSEQSWQRLKTKLTPNQYITIRYEDLICHPENELKKLCQFLAVKYDQKMLSYSKNSTYEKPNETLVEQWKYKQSRYEIATVELKAAKLMELYGYYQHSDIDFKLNLYDMCLLGIQNTMVKNFFDIKRYGVLLWFGEKFTRKLSLNMLRKQVIKKRDVITVKYLK